MQGSTISVSPIPQTTTPQKIKDIFHAFSVKNVHVDGKTAFVQFSDEGDYDNLQIQFENYEVEPLNNAKITKLQNFDWSAVKKADSSQNNQSSSQSSGHVDLMAADVDNLIVIENCDENKLKDLSVQYIRDLFKAFPSVNRIVKRKNDVIVEFSNFAELQGLENSFGNYEVPQLGPNAKIEKADRFNVNPDDFVSEWQKSHAKESLMTQPSTSLGYAEEKPSQLSEPSPKEQKTSQQFLHHDIIPPFDKKTSMEVNFLNEQSKLGYQQREQEPIHEASTHQQLDYTSQVNIQNEEKLGYEAAQKQEQERRKNEQDQKRKDEEQRQRQQQERRRQQARRQQEERRRVQEERSRQQERRRRQQQLRRQQEDQRKIQKEQDRRRFEQEKQKARKQEQAKKIFEEELERKRRQSQALDKQLKEKLYAQRAKFMKQVQTKKTEEQPQAKQQRHQPPTESDIVAKEGEFLRNAEESIEQQLGYAVNKAKQESANLLNSGLEMLKEKTTKVGQHPSELGYEKWSVKPDVSIPRPVVETQNRTLKTLITITLFIWVIFLLMQGTSDVVEEIKEIKVEATEM